METKLIGIYLWALLDELEKIGQLDIFRIPEGQGILVDVGLPYPFRLWSPSIGRLVATKYE